MPSAQDFAERLRKQAYRTLSPQIGDLEQELQNVASALSAGIQQIERRLEALRHIELPTTEPVLDEFLGEALRRKDLVTGDLAHFTRGMRQRETQEEILTFLLDSAQSCSPRTALYVVRGDRFIGWSPEVRIKNLSLITYNTRFLILPWVQVKNLASHILSQMARNLSRDWQEQYNHPVYYLETFVDKSRFSGVCYQAANWIYLGDTTGRGKDDHTNKPNRTIKAVWGYALTKRFREHLCHVG